MALLPDEEGTALRGPSLPATRPRTHGQHGEISRRHADCHSPGVLKSLFIPCSLSPSWRGREHPRLRSAENISAPKHSCSLTLQRLTQARLRKIIYKHITQSALLINKTHLSKKRERIHHSNDFFLNRSQLIPSNSTGEERPKRK